MTFPLYPLIFLGLALFSIFSAAHAILYKRDSRAAFGWLVTCLVFVGVGPCLYWLFGINRIRTHAKRLYRLGSWKRQAQTETPSGSNRLPAEHSFFKKDYKGLLQVSESVNRHPLMVGNRIGVLHNGDEAYPAMLEAIGQAEKFVYLSTYIFDSDETGRVFIRALAEAQRKGVQVRVLVDAFGEKYSRPRISALLKQEGIRVGLFLPLSLSVNSLHFNLRNHRKLLVVDGKTGFTGGMNIRGRHYQKEPSIKNSITDIHFKVEGPVVLELQEVFLEDWFFATRESLPWMAHPHPLFPGETVCRAVSGGPNEDFEKINWMILGALSWAQKWIQVMTPYFVPDRVLISALNTAALRGVSVEVMVPEKNNLPYVDWASRGLFWEMLQNGVKFFYQGPAFSHSKLFIVDESYALIGSSNWDARSLRLNFELDLEVYDPAFAQLLSRHFEEVKIKARPITLEEMNGASLPIQFRNSLAKLFAPYL